MIKHKIRMVTGLTGLLVATGVNGLLNDAGDGWVGSAYAQDADSADDSADAAEMDESSAEDTGDASEGESGEESTTDEGDSGFEEEEESEPVGDAGGTEESESPASDEEAPVETTDEPAAEVPAEPDPAPPAVAAQPEPQAQQAPPSQPVSNHDRVREVLVAAIREVVPGLDSHAFADSDRLADLGANSVDRAEIAMLTTERLGLNVPRVELFAPKNLGELIALLASKMP